MEMLSKIESINTSLSPLDKQFRFHPSNLFSTFSITGSKTLNDMDFRLKEDPSNS